MLLRLLQRALGEEAEAEADKRALEEGQHLLLVVVVVVVVVMVAVVCWPQ